MPALLPNHLLDYVQPAFALFSALIVIRLVKGALKRYNDKKFLTSHFPQPRGTLPILGNVLALGKEDPMSDLVQWAKTYGPTFVFEMLFGHCQLVTADPAVLTHVSTKNRDNYKLPSWFGGRVSEFLGNGMILVEGDHHRRQRRILTPVFSQGNVNQYMDDFHSAGQRLVERWEAALSGGDASNGVENKKELNVFEDICNCFLDLIGKAGFDYDFGALNSGNNPFAGAYRDVNDGMAVSTLWGRLIALYPIIDLLPTANKARFRKAVKVIFDNMDSLIRRAREGAASHTEGRKDLMTRLLTHEKEMTLEHELRYQMATFMIAGHETTSLVLSYALYLLGRHPEKQERLRDELRGLMPTSSSVPPAARLASDNHVEGMTYLSAVVKETLRLHPPLPMPPPKVAINDDSVIIDGKECPIPAGTEIVFSPNVMHRLPQYWGDDADEFRPERWLEKNDETHFFPFGTGKRMCVGWRFALMELKVVLASVIRSLRVEVSDDYIREASSNPRDLSYIGKEMSLTLKPKPDLRLVLSRA